MRSIQTGSTLAQPCVNTCSRQTTGTPSTKPTYCVRRTIPSNAGCRRPHIYTATAISSTATEATRSPLPSVVSSDDLDIISQWTIYAPRRQSRRLTMFQLSTPRMKNFLPLKKNPESGYHISTSIHLWLHGLHMYPHFTPKCRNWACLTSTGSIFEI